MPDGIAEDIIICRQIMYNVGIQHEEEFRMSTMMHYTVILEREEDGGYHAFTPALKGCHSQGESVDDAITNIREAISAYLESLTARGEAIPTEDILIKPVEVAA